MMMLLFFMCAAIFAQIEAGLSSGTQMRSAAKVALAVFVILTVAALVGVKVLHLFGLSLDAFMVAGGGALAWQGFSMVRWFSVNSRVIIANGGSRRGRARCHCVADAADPLRGQPGNDHRCHYTFASARQIRDSDHRVSGRDATAVMWLYTVLVARLGGSGSGGFVHESLPHSAWL
jgi:hypothetical protein